MDNSCSNEKWVMLCEWLEASNGGSWDIEMPKLKRKLVRPQRLNSGTVNIPQIEAREGALLHPSHTPKCLPHFSHLILPYEWPSCSHRHCNVIFYLKKLNWMSLTFNPMIFSVSKLVGCSCWDGWSTPLSKISEKIDERFVEVFALMISQQ